MQNEISNVHLCFWVDVYAGINQTCDPNATSRAEIII